MARLLTSGFEMNKLGTNSATGWVAASGAPSIATDQKRTGTYSLKCNFANFASTSATVSYIGTSEVYVRFWFRINAIPDLNMSLARIDTHDANYASIEINSAGKIVLYAANSTIQLGITAGAVYAGTWYSVLWRYKYSSTAGYHEMKVLGETITDTTNDGTTANCDNLELGHFIGGASANTIWFDDVSINDTSGSNENGYPDANGKIIFLKPTSDNAINGWLAGAGGNTNLWDAVDNTPPVGVASGSETNTTNIYSVTDSATDDCDFNCTDYTTAGVGSNDVIKLVIPYVRHGEDIATGTKGGAVKIVSNPVQSVEDTFNFGNNAGAHGAEIGNWRNKIGTPQYSPTVVKGTSPVIRVGKRTATTAKVCSDLIGIIVEYTTTLLWKQGAEVNETKYITSPNPTTYESTAYAKYCARSFKLLDASTYTLHSFATSNFATGGGNTLYGQLWIYPIQWGETTGYPDLIVPQTYGGAVSANIRIVKSSGSLYMIIYSGGAERARTANAISFNQWTRIQWKVSQFGAASSVEAKLPGVPETISWSGALGAAIDTFQYLTFMGGAWNYAGDGWYVDEIELRYDQYPVPEMKINSITKSAFSNVNGIVKASISKINGVSI